MNNILLINYHVKNDTGLEKVLISEEFNVVAVKEDSSPADLPEGFTPRLIICHTGARDPGSRGETFFDLIRRYNPHDDAAVVIVSSVADPDLYLRALESNIVYHIHTPCSRDFLMTRLNSIIEQEGNPAKRDKSYTLKFSYRDLDYDISLSRGSMEKFFISLMENSAQQNAILNDIVFNDLKVSCITRNSEIIENKFVCPEGSISSEEGILEAFEKNEFRLLYQPVISLKDDSIHGFEALIRWDRNKVIISPDEFIPIIENSMHISRLGDWIADEASRQLKAWQDEIDTGKSLHININLSPRQFEDPNLCGSIYDIISKNGILPGNIGIEVTENVLMKDREAANLILLQFKSRGFNLYMDDFGTGYSSLSYLLNFPFNIMKIDKSFVQWMHFDRQSEEIVRSVVALAHNLSKHVVAEGVELEEHLKILREIQCDYCQGFFFSGPLDNVAATEMIRESFGKGKGKKMKGKSVSSG